MNYTLLFNLALLCSLNIPFISSFKAQLHMQHMNATKIDVEIECTLEPEELLLGSSVQFSTNNPSVKIAKWYTLQDAQTFFDTRSKKSEQAYSGLVTFILVMESSEKITPQTIIHMHYATNKTQEPQEKYFPITPMISDKKELGTEKQSLTLPENNKIYEKSTVTQYLTKLTTYVTAWIQDKELPLALKFILAFIIGLMMSLTPCIYPMIPITMGILQANKAHSILRGFLLASAYTAGLSMTFAILGMIAALGGSQFGSIMTNPFIIAPIIFFFAYLGFSMLGFYEMYIPRFMQPKQGHKNTGSFASAFTFGMINGTVASPCLSPGLALILGIVSGLGNPLLGFLLLFVFGIGSSFPLLIIGTFSTSLHIFPRAGKWMIEFKKIFGFLLLGMCLYYLKTFMPESIFYLLLGLYIIVVASYYLRYGFTHRSFITKMLGLLLCIAAALTFTESYRAALKHSGEEASRSAFPWQKADYEEMRLKAIHDKKLLLLDFTADWCSLCKKLENEFFNETRIYTELPELVIPLKVDCTHANDQESALLRKKFKIIGFPTILLIDPTTETILKKWAADLNDKDPQEIISEISAQIKEL